jgi:hypothetical protein
MIHSTSQSHGSYRADAIPPHDGLSHAPRKIQQPGIDSLSTENAESLRQSLANTPEIRPEVVEAGRRLAIDPNYPPREIIEQLAKMFTNAVDPSDEG